MIIKKLSLTVALVAGIAFTSLAQNDKAWIAKSNKYTTLLLNIDKKYSPEFGSSQGLAQYDTQVSVPTLENILAANKERMQVIATLKAAKKTEPNEAVRQDIDILINQTQLGLRSDEFELQKKASFLNATSNVFSGLQTLLDDQTLAPRRLAALTRLRKYAGLVKGVTPISAIYKERVQKQINRPQMIYPSKCKSSAKSGLN